MKHGTVVKVRKGRAWYEYVWLAPLRCWARYANTGKTWLLVELIGDRTLYRRGKRTKVYDPVLGELHDAKHPDDKCNASNRPQHTEQRVTAGLPPG